MPHGATSVVVHACGGCCGAVLRHEREIAAATAVSHAAAFTIAAAIAIAHAATVAIAAAAAATAATAALAIAALTAAGLATSTEPATFAAAAALDGVESTVLFCAHSRPRRGHRSHMCGADLPHFRVFYSSRRHEEL